MTALLRLICGDWTTFHRGDGCYYCLTCGWDMPHIINTAAPLCAV